MDYIYVGLILLLKNQKMKTFYMLFRFLSALLVVLFFSFSSCQKEETIPGLTEKILGVYQGEYREGDEDFTVIVSNVTGTASKLSDEQFYMQLELVPGVFSVDFTGDMQSASTFIIHEFELDGDLLQGEGLLEGNLLEISFFESGTEKTYASYVAMKQ